MMVTMSLKSSTKIRKCMVPRSGVQALVGNYENALILYFFLYIIVMGNI